MVDAQRRIGRGQGKRRHASGGDDSSPLWDALGMLTFTRGRLKDPRTYLLLAAGAWLFNWLSDDGGDDS